jgi:hypothetical protein
LHEAERRHAGDLRTGAGKVAAFRPVLPVMVHGAVGAAPGCGR